MKFSNGFSSYLSFGRNNGLKIQKDGPSIRISLFRLSFCIGWFDIENTLRNLLDEVQKNDLRKEDQKRCDALIGKNIELEETIRVLQIESRKFKDTETRLKKQAEELSETLDDLMGEITDLTGFETENHKLKDQIEVLENRIKELEKLGSSSSSSSESSLSEIDYYI